MIETGLYEFLSTEASIAAINGAQVYPLVKPQNEDQTSIVYRFLPKQFGRTFCGEPNITLSRVQLDCWATSYAGAKALATAVRQALDFYSGDMGGFPVLSVQWQFENDDFEDDIRFYRVIQDIKIFHH